MRFDDLSSKNDPNGKSEERLMLELLEGEDFDTADFLLITGADQDESGWNDVESA